LKRLLIVSCVLVIAALAYVRFFGVPAPVAQYAPSAADWARRYLVAIPETQPRQQGRQRSGADGPIPVVAAQARMADLPVTQEAIGTVQALNTVTVRAQVDGRLIELAFKDGQEVKKGDVLARIDPATYQAQYDQTAAKKAQDEAQLANAKTDLQRYEKLAQGEYGSRQQADTQRATVAQLEAQIRSDQAQIDNAKAILDYTTIRAPIDGRTGIRLIDQGNIVHASDSTGIVIVTQVQPISVVFNIPQQQLRAVNAAMARHNLSVEALESDNKMVIDNGTVEVIDNQIDPLTGTMRLKATFPNAELQLWPGQFVNVRLFVDTLTQVVVVPTAAVQRGPNGPFVYVLGDDNTVHMTSVAVGQQDEVNTVVTSGLDAATRVITTGFVRLTDGAAVVAGTAPAGSETTPAGTPQDRPAGQRRRSRSSGGDAATGTEPANNEQKTPPPTRDRSRGRRSQGPEANAAPAPSTSGPP
jgi:membrane fusion protein, multidrug efflux system